MDFIKIELVGIKNMVINEEIDWIKECKDYKIKKVDFCL